MRVKIFTDGDTSKLEENIREWLDAAANDGFTGVTMTQTEDSAGFLTITIIAQEHPNVITIN